MTMLEKLEQNDFDLETFRACAILAFRDFYDEDGNVDESRLADVGKGIFTDEVKAELSAEMDELLVDNDVESAEEVANAVCTCMKVAIDKVCDTWLRSKFIEALETEVE